ncbi:scavenger receptor class F member 1-like [Crassostrea angulata]|uniref:scavenger receptor class F member 1-like n=1 Tax=Magallana angulata TaxID=2784310 RepID=UPI0022B10C67|nr:scavenger receptor class F member 1-like [Crassostrea angulata]
MIRRSTHAILQSTMFVSKSISYILYDWSDFCFSNYYHYFFKFDQEGSMLTVWIALTLYLSIGYAANRDVRLKVNCSSLLNKQLFHRHSNLWNVSKSSEVFLKMNCRKFDSTLAHIEDELENQWLRKQYPDIKTAQVCPLGKFGWHCKFSCFCAGGDCDSDTGHCPSGCKNDRYGPGCQLLSVYRYSKLAHGYLENMDRTESGKQCVQGNSTVFVKCYGLHASYFPDKKIPGAVCRNMLDKVLNRLGPKDKGPWCFTNYSEDSNFMESCDLPLQGCDPGKFGEMCEFECHCKNEEPCFYLGSCPHGCHPGWMNTTCQTKCESGRYGDGCNSNCGECKSGPCNIETGECEGGCAAGWKGALCKTSE